MLEKAKIKPPYIIRVISKEKINLYTLSEKLEIFFEINISNISKRINGLGSQYFELTINKRQESIKALKHNLINDEQLKRVQLKDERKN